MENVIRMGYIRDRREKTVAFFITSIRGSKTKLIKALLLEVHEMIYEYTMDTGTFDQENQPLSTRLEKEGTSFCLTLTLEATTILLAILHTTKLMF